MNIRFRIQSVCLLLLMSGCSSGEYREAVQDNDPEAVVALKEAGAKIRQLPIPGQSGIARSVDLRDLTATPEVLEHLFAVKDVLELKITGAEIKDAEVEKIAGMKVLSILDLSGTAVTDDGLSHLSGKNRLSTLNLDDTAITGKGLALLPQVKSLSLSNVAIGDSDLENLNHLRQLNFVNLAGTNVSAAGVKELRRKKGNVMVMGVKVN